MPDAESSELVDATESVRREITIHVRLFAGFAVTVTGHEIDSAAWKRRKAAAIVKLLALAPTHRLHRDQVIDVLWPEADAEQGANALYQALHVARLALAPESASDSLIVLRDQMLSFHPDAQVWVDVDTFESAVATANRTQDVADYRAAMTLYTGDLLPDDRYEPWATERREVLRERFLSLAMVAATRLQEAGDVAGAIDAARRMLALDPLHEPAHRVLMGSYARSGQRQRALRQYEALRELLAAELDVEPEAETEQLLMRIRSGEDGRVESQATNSTKHIAHDYDHDREHHNLPASISSFVGREREMHEVRHLLGRTRLLTLQGPGGCGKTRLSLEVGREVAGDFRDGVWMVELAGLTDPVLLPQAVAAALDVREMPGQPLLETLVPWIRPREMLIILDNCEHLIDACANVADRLLRSGPDVRILATSREPLRVPGEITWLVPSLELPDLSHSVPVDQLMEHASVRLFVDRARSMNPAFEITDAVAHAVAELCVRLDGIPLALELAAARTRALSVKGIVERLDDRFKLLTGGSRAAMSRQQTLRAALDWSYDLLSESERVLFDRLSVFAGELDLQAAEAICADPPLDLLDVVDLLAQLVDRSLVVTTPADSIVRYRLLETMRAYGRERLEQRGEYNHLRQAHARYYAALARDGDLALRGAGQTQEQWLRQLEREHDNFRAALEWSRESADPADRNVGLVLAGALHWFWHRAGHFTEGRRWLDLLLDTDDEGIDPTTRAYALTGAGVLAVTSGDYIRADTLLRQAIELWRGMDDPGGLPLAVAWLGWVALFHGDVTGARAHHQEALDNFVRRDDTWGTALAALGLGFDAAEQNDLDEARGAFGRSLTGFRDAGDDWGIATTLHQLANLDYRASAFNAARQRAEEIRDLVHRMGDHWLETSALGLLSEIARAEGNLDTASAMTDAVLALARDYGQLATHGWTLRDAGFIALARGDVDAALVHFQAGLNHFHTRDYPLGIACCLLGFAGVAIERGDADLAGSLLGTTRATLDRLSLALAPADRHEATRIEQRVMSELGSDGYELALEVGGAIALSDAIASVEAALCSPS